MVIVIGLGAALLIIGPQVPFDRHVTLRLEDASTITGIDVTWERRPRRATEAAMPLRAITWHFVEGSAPSVLNKVTPLPDGDYNVDVTVERGDRRSTSHRVVVVGRSDNVTIPVR